jgi:polysaccharide export outer membrane protein
MFFCMTFLNLRARPLPIDMHIFKTFLIAQLTAPLTVMLAAGLTALVLAGSASYAKESVPAPKVSAPVVAPAAAPAAAAQVTATPAAPAPSVDNNYIIGPGDVLQVFVWRNAELTTSVPVRPDGKITTPLVEDMVAVGKTPTQLQHDIEKVLAEYIRAPQVNVIVTQPLSTFSQVKVIGQVAHPQSLPYREGMTVLDAVLASGGLGQFAAGNRAKLVRTENGKTHEIRIKLSNLVNDGDLAQNVPLKPGDVLVVPESRF